ncbi:promotilin [Latimeria chalumnae]|uniref:promotilin n=1 Tax=Latimeria chalumnae TaxID=7897 RepID=UPI0003C10878|nr:PREDICTED: promotilin [Latimeria chalumnae]XP_014343621.1 PREDICTED: promotilin [Latimeria chalumnae]|eukprot:XP_005995529.1 PREDICTED: promotilin [Latimeria chalumnae]
MDSRRVIGALLVVCAVVMLAERTEGFISFFSPSDMRRMMEKEKSKALKKSVSLQQRSEDNSFLESPSVQYRGEGMLLKPGDTLESRVRLNMKQVDNYRDILGEMLGEILQEEQNAQ